MTHDETTLRTRQTEIEDIAPIGDELSDDELRLATGGALTGVHLKATWNHGPDIAIVGDF
jgi:hypothetical protein